MFGKTIKNNRALILILLVAAIAFIPVLHGSYLLDWDDNKQILDNKDVTTLSWLSIKNFFSTFYVRSYQPLASLSFGIEYYFFGPNASIPHAVNYLLHICNVFLAFRFLNALFPKQKNLVLISTAIFALSPIQTETIAWISTRSTLLFTGFYLLSCKSYANYVGTQHKKYFAFCVFFFILALFSKSAAITLPVVLVLIDFLVHRKWSKRTIIEKVPLFLLSIIFGLVSVFSRELSLERKTDFDLYYSWYEKVCLACHSFLFYIGKAVIPYPLRNFYEYPLRNLQHSLSPLYAISFFVCILSLTLATVLRRHILSFFPRPALFGFLFFTCNVALILSFFSFSPAMLAERYDYLAIIGLAVFFVSLLESKITKSSFQAYFPLFFIPVFLIYTVLSFQQSGVWKNQGTLWSHTLRYSHDSYPFIRYADYLHQQKDLKGSLNYFNEAAKINPYDPELYIRRGYLIMDLDDNDYAKKDFTRVIESSSLTPPQKRAQAYLGRARVEVKLNDLENAEKDTEHAISLYPDAESLALKNELLQKKSPTPNLHPALSSLTRENILLYAKKLFSDGNFKQTIIQCQGYLLFNRTSIECHLLMAQAFAALHQPGKALSEYDLLIDQLKLQDGPTYFLRAQSLIELKNRVRACIDLEIAIRAHYLPATKLRDNYCRNRN